MKIKENYVLQEVVDEFIIVPVGAEANLLHGIIKLNASGAYLWKLLLEKDSTQIELANALVSEYQISEIKAKEDVADFIKVLDQLGCIEH